MKKLFEPIQVKSMVSRNRMVVSAMVTGFCDEDGLANETFIAYHEAKAKGGWGIIIPEDYVIAPNVGSGTRLPGLYDDSQIPSHNVLTDRIHAHGAKIVCQIYHAGRRMATGAEIVAPSAIPFSGGISPIPRELTVSEIEEIVEQFGQCALRAKKAGFDGVEIHGAHGYLLQTFLSPLSNKRTDEYGGSLYGRAKIALDIVKRVRQLVGEDYPILYRMSATDHLEQGSVTLEDSKAFAMMLEEAGVDMLHVSQGGDNASIVQPPSCMSKAAYVNNAAEIKKVVNIPVIAVGRINDPFIAEEVLASGKADMVTMARASVADPEMPNKAKAGEYAQINYCIGCGQGCTRGCTVNPMIGRESICIISQAEKVKTIYVAGGGISGCEYAIFAAKRGHKVVLFEKSGKLGGQWLAACIPPGKTDFTSLVKWQRYELQASGVEVRLNTALTKAIVEADKPDVVVIATGGAVNVPPIKGVHEPQVVQAQDVLLGKAVFGPNVVIIGGGSVGAETADHVSLHGAAQVTVVEMLGKIAGDADAKPRYYLMKRLHEKNVQLLCNTKVVGMADGVVTVEQDGVQKELPKADTIILACGVHPNNALKDELADYAGEVIVVGDANRIKDGNNNMKEAFLASFEI